ncbi:MAG TPA: hypothetical protein PLB89_05125 [Flavobacteriales bacterium]|nr:hypothetical protein [Flavobacteriales bacterium]
MSAEINKTLAARIAEIKGSPYIDKLVWLAAQVINRDAIDLCEDIINCSNPGKRVLKTFPGLENDITDTDNWDDGEQLATALADSDRLGFLAMIQIPDFHSFRFKNGKPVGWGVSGFISTVEFVYAESLDELVKLMEERAEAEFADAVRMANKKGAAKKK